MGGAWTAYKVTKAATRKPTRHSTSTAKSRAEAVDYAQAQKDAKETLNTLMWIMIIVLFLGTVELVDHYTHFFAQISGGPTDWNSFYMRKETHNPG